MKRLITTTLVAAFVLSVGFGTGIASAQTAPATTSSSTTVAQAPAKKDPPKHPFLIIHLTPTATYMVGSSDLPRPSVGPYACTPVSGGTCGPTGNYQYANPIGNLGYGAQINFAPKWSLNYTHGFIFQNIGRVTTLHNTYTYQVLNYDRTDDASLDYNLHGVSIAAGWHERVRICCGQPNPPTEKNMVAYHYEYLKLADRLLGPANRYYGKLVGLTVQGAYIPHNTSPYFANPYCTATAAECLTPAYGAFPNGGDKTLLLYAANVTLPIGANEKTAKFALWGTYQNNFDYFMNSPIMYLYNQVDFGIMEKFSPWVTLNVDNSNLYQHHEGYPYVFPNVLNRNKLIVTLDIALPFY